MYIRVKIKKKKKKKQYIFPLSEIDMTPSNNEES